MDLAFLDFDFSSYIFGTLTVGGAWLTTVKGRNILAKKRGENVLDAVEEFLKKAEPDYLEWIKKFKPLDERYASAVSDFKLTFPKKYDKGRDNLLRMHDAFTMNSHHQSQKTLDEMLGILNNVKSNDLNSLDMDKVQSRWNSLSDFMGRLLYALDSSAKIFEDAVKYRPNRIEVAKKTQKELKVRLDKAQETIAVIEATYDPLFWVKIPPALKRAVTPYENVTRDVSELDKEFYFYPRSLDKSLENANTMIKRLENHIDKVVNYNDVAHRKANKLRQNMNRAWQMRYGGYRKAIPKGAQDVFEAAKLSILTAETQEYVGGNPEKDFEETVQPYYELLNYLSTKK